MPPCKRQDQREHAKRHGEELVLTPIHIMVSRHSAFYSPLIAAISAGFLEQEGLDAAYSIMTPNNTLAAGLADGTVHVGQSAVSSSWSAMESGQSNAFVHFAQINERDGFFLVGRQPDPKFAWGKLAGREVLVDHFGQPLAMFKYAAHRMGLDYAEINAVDAGDVHQIERAFCEGRGDFVHLQGPAPQQMEQAGMGYVVALVGEAIGPVAFSSLVATRDWLETDAAVAFMRAYRGARDYVNQSMASVIAESEAGFFKGVDHESLTRAIALYQKLGCWNPDVHISERHYDAALDVFLHSGVITKRHPFADVVVPPPDER